MLIFVSILTSTLTILSMWMIGNGDRKGWVVGLVNQLAWLILIILSGTWGLLILTLTLTAIYSRNLIKWSNQKDIYV